MECNTPLNDKRRLLALVILDEYKTKFRVSPRKEYLDSLAIHLAPKYSSTAIKKILDKACETLDHYPSISQLGGIAVILGIAVEGTSDSNPRACEKCNFTGLILLENEAGHNLAWSCPDCERGVALSSKISSSFHASKAGYFSKQFWRKGTGLHPKLKARFGAFENLQKAIDNKTISTTELIKESFRSQ